MYNIRAIIEYESFLFSKELWDLLSVTHLNYNGSEVEDGYSGEKILFEDFGNYLNLNDKEDFRLEFNDSSIEYGDISDSKLAALYFKNIALNEKDAEQWLSNLLQDKRLILATLYDGDYDIWQNMDDIEYYKASNRSYDSLPLKSNGLPFPLEATVVDTSNNPGRYIFKEGYIECVGSVMWLGEQFWEKTDASKKEVLACDWLETQAVGKAIKIKAYDKVFTSGEGLEGKIQNKLRDLLYPHHS